MRPVNCAPSGLWLLCAVGPGVKTPGYGIAPLAGLCQHPEPGGRQNIARVWSEAEPLVMRQDFQNKPFAGDTINIGRSIFGKTYQR